MLDHFQRFLYTENLNPASDSILIGISGGVDSVVMAHLFINSGFKIALAHVNYGLRGIESDQDEELVRAYASTWKVPVYVIAYPNVPATKGNFQENARNFRYQWFSSLAEQNDYSYVAIAHHADDQIETSLLNMMRAAGIHGLSAMQSRNGALIRPLLSVFKEELYAYAKKEGLEFREDASNQISYYRRNYLRNNVIPLLESGFPNAKVNVLKCISLLNQSIALTEWLITNSDGVKEDNSSKVIDVSAVGKSPDPIEYLYWIMRSALFTPTQLSDIWRGRPGSKIETAVHLAIREKNYIRLFKKSSMPAPFDIKVIDWGEHILPHARIVISALPLPKSTNSENFELLFKGETPFPFTLRPKKPGDVFLPKGMDGKSKTVKKFLSDQGLDYWQRKRVVIIDSNDSIAAVLPYRVSHLPDTPQNDNRVYLSFSFL
ncbi:MAG: tRNA lysidine(34) synthetase TilS [Saprospiraceae bacterium]|nr:tRNA lysidine(34) synthetase TilS [Saprospiraceae bacterium]